MLNYYGILLCYVMSFFCVGDRALTLEWTIVVTICVTLYYPSIFVICCQIIIIFDQKKFATNISWT
jgi:hypothetical protein